MIQIQIHDFLSTKVSSEYNTIITVDIDDKPFAVGGFGEVYHCHAINGNKLTVPQVIKIFLEKYPGSADTNFNTIKRLQSKFDKLNQELILKQSSLIEEYPAFVAIPQFSFTGNLNGRMVKGYSSDNLKLKNYFEFEDVLTDTKLLDKFYKTPVPRRIYFAYQLVSAFKILDDFKYIHADLKPGAIFLNLDNQSLAIIDYDSGVITETQRDKPTTWGAPNDWVAPEIWTQQINITKGDKIRVDSFTDKWSVAVGVNYLITGIHPLFYLKELGPGITKQYFNSTQWPNADTNANYFEKDNESYYHQYINFINTEIPPQIKDKIDYTINFGYKNPAARTSYNDWQKALKSIQNPPHINFCTISKTELLEGEDVVIAWSAENAVSVEVSNINGVYSALDKVTFKATSSKDYTIKFKGYYGEAIETFKIKVIPAPKIINFSSDYTKLKKGQNTRIVWNINNCTTVTIFNVDKLPQKVSSNGSLQISPNKTTTYKIEILALDNKTITSEYITVSVFSEGEIISFKSNLQYILPTVPVLLTWKTKNAIKVELLGVGDVANNGELELQPKGDTTYLLRLTDHFGIIEQKLEVKMLPLPIIEKVKIPTPLIISNNIINVSMPNYATVSSQLPTIIEFNDVDYRIKLDSSLILSTPELVENEYEIQYNSFTNKIQRIFSQIKNEFITNNKHKYVIKK